MSSYVLKEKFYSDTPERCLSDEVNWAHEIILLKCHLSFCERFILQAQTKTVIVLSRIKDPIYFNTSYFIKITSKIKLVINASQSAQSKSVRSVTTKSAALRAECFNRAGTDDFNERHRWTLRNRGENSKINPSIFPKNNEPAYP